MSRITLVLPKLTPGGTERTAAELANYFSEQNMEVTIIVMYRKEVFFQLNKEITLIEPNWSPQSRIGKTLYWLYLWIYLRKKIKKSTPDVVLFLGYILIGLWSVWGSNYKVYFSNRTNPYRERFPGHTLLNRLYNFQYQLLKSKVNGIVAQTEIAKEFYLKKFQCPIKVIPNSLKKMKYFPGSIKENIVITIGRAVPEKGQKYYIKLVSELCNHSLDFRFLFIGDGPELIKLKQYAKELNILDQIEFLGFKDNVDYYLSIAKYFVLTSVTEGYPNVLIESMAHGCVPCAFNCIAGPSDIISHGKNGFLFEVGDVVGIKNELIKLNNDPELSACISKNAQKVKETNSSDILSREWIDFILN